MKRKKIWGYALKALMTILVLVIICGLYWGWKYYGLPEWPDNRKCRTIEQRAENALRFARRHNMNDHYALFVDYSIIRYSKIIRVGLPTKENCGHYLRNAWSRKR